MENETARDAGLGHGREWLEAVLDSIADAVIVTDEACRITRMNPVAERLTGWTLEEGEGKRLEEVLVVRSKTSGERIDCPVARALANGGRVASAFPADAIVVRRDGTETPVDDSLALIREHGGRVLGAVIVFRDATARRREMERLTFLADASVELSASLDFEKTLSTVAKLAVPAFADFCKVVMVIDGVLRPVACTHVDPEKRLDWRWRTSNRACWIPRWGRRTSSARASRSSVPKSHRRRSRSRTNAAESGCAF
jgi:PAS domain S-box-containing protein